MPKEDHCLMLNLVVEKGASKDRDRSRSSITRLGRAHQRGLCKDLD